MPDLDPIHADTGPGRGLRHCAPIGLGSAGGRPPKDGPAVPMTAIPAQRRAAFAGAATILVACILYTKYQTAHRAAADADARRKMSAPRSLFKLDPLDTSAG